MFDYDIAQSNHFTNKSDTEHAFATWKSAVGIVFEDFSFKVKTGKMFKGKEIVFEVVGWGSYVNADAQWIVFINYYARAPKHTIQYNWQAGDGGKVVGIPRKYEFVN
jgi:hypothetical protein